MSDIVLTYRKSLKHSLHCSRLVSSRLMSRFDHMMHPYLEEHPAPTGQQLTDAFGTPEELAQSLLEEVTPEERRRHARVSLTCRVAAVLLAVFLLGFGFYFLFVKEHNFIVTDCVTIYEEASK